MKLEKFIEIARDIILNHIDDEDFNVGKLAEYLNLSRSQTLRKIKASTGFSANEFIREVRLEKSIELLRDENLTISEISYRVGFNNPSYFNKCFHDRYDYSPGEYREKILNSEIQETPMRKTYKSVYIGVAAIIIILSLIWWHQINFHNQNQETYKSIAVLPLQDYSENQDKEYLALGLTDAITSELAKIKGLRVPSRGSAMYFQDSLRVYDEIAKELNVDLLLEGSIISEGEQLRVIIQLIDPTPYERHIWQNEYDKSATNFLQLSSSVSQQIAKEINLVVSGQEILIEYIKPEAEELLLKGRYLWQKKHPDDVNQAINYLNQAVVLEPEFSEAYFNLARAYMAKNELEIGSNDEVFISKNENRKHILENLNKALEFNQSFAEAYILKGWIAGKFDWNWEEMKYLVSQGLELNPNSIEGHELMADYYTVKGMHELAIQEIELAETLDPMNLEVSLKCADKYMYNGNFSMAENKLKEILQLNSYHIGAYDKLGFLYFLMKDKVHALEMFKNLHILLKNQDLVDYYSNNNFDVSMDFWLDNVNSGEKMYCRNPQIIAMANQLRNRENKSIEYLNLAYQYKYSDLPVILMHPIFNSIRSQPEFVEIANKVGVQTQF